MVSGNDYFATVSLELPQHPVPEELGPQQSQSYYIEHLKRGQTSQQRLAELRGVVFRGRLRLREKRKELREERAVCEKVYANIIGYVQGMVEKGLVPEQSALELLYVELQATRDSLGSLEYEYDRAEDEYEGVEEELEDAETLATSFAPSPLDESDEESYEPSLAKDNTFTAEAFSNSASQSPDMSIVERYQSRVGDARIIRERLHEIVQTHTKKHLTDRIRVSIGLNNNSLPLHGLRYIHGPEPLQNLKAAYSEGIKDLKLIQEEAELLRPRALASGCAAQKPYWPDLPSSISTDDLTTKESPTSSVVQTHQSDSAIPYFQRNFRSARARINKWILRGLEGSQVEHARHKGTLRSLQDSSLDDESWARLVADWWKKDELGVSAQSDYWELVSPGDSSSNSTAEAKSTTLMCSETSRVSRALQKFDLKFFARRTLQTIPRRSAFSVFKYRGAPYKAHLDLDMLSKYESRSI